MSTYKDEFHRLPMGPDAKAYKNRVLIYFIPGNPGLIEYYRCFLSYLSNHLNRSFLINDRKTQRTCHVVHGNSLAGFEVSPGSQTTNGTAFAKDPPLSLNEQIDDVYARLDAVIERTLLCRPEEGQLPVILIGHSIGSYIALEIIRKWQQAARNGPSRMKIVGGICLFPTICELAESPAGRVAGPLARVPFFPTAVHVFAAALFYLVPISAVAWLVASITGQPKQGSEVTAEFLKSKHGVEQALGMAKDEIAHVTTDIWSNEFWGSKAADEASSATSESLGQDAGSIMNGDSHVEAAGLADSAASVKGQAAHAQLYFFWGKGDHWVAESTRDNIIASRARVEGRTGDEQKPVMMVDQTGLPHAFCLSESGSVAVARQCEKWIQDIEHKLFDTSV